MLCRYFRDKSIPPLSSIMAGEADELSKLSTFIAEQAQLEQRLTSAVQAERKTAPFPDPETECKPPRYCGLGYSCHLTIRVDWTDCILRYRRQVREYQILSVVSSYVTASATTSRPPGSSSRTMDSSHWKHWRWSLLSSALLSVHSLSFKTLVKADFANWVVEKVLFNPWLSQWSQRRVSVHCIPILLVVVLFQEPSGSSMPASLVQLDSMEPGFLADLQQLDALPCRTADTVHVFYVKTGQKMPFEILSNVVRIPSQTLIGFLLDKSTQTCCSEHTDLLLWAHRPVALSTQTCCFEHTDLLLLCHPQLLWRHYVSLGAFFMRDHHFSVDCRIPSTMLMTVSWSSWGLWVGLWMLRNMLDGLEVSTPAGKYRALRMMVSGVNCEHVMVSNTES